MLPSLTTRLNLEHMQSLKALKICTFEELLEIAAAVKEFPFILFLIAKVD